MRKLLEGDVTYPRELGTRIPVDHILLEGKPLDLMIGMAIVQGLNLGVERGKFSEGVAGNESTSPVSYPGRTPLNLRLYRYGTQGSGENGGYKNTVIYGDEARLALDALCMSFESKKGPGQLINARQQSTVTKVFEQFIASIQN